MRRIAPSRHTSQLAATFPVAYVPIIRLIHNSTTSATNMNLSFEYGATSHVNAKTDVYDGRWRLQDETDANPENAVAVAADVVTG